MFVLASFTLSFAASALLLLALVLAAVALAVWVYRATVPEISPARKWTLVSLRALAVALLLFLVFEPVLNLRSVETLPPNAAVLFDNSRSLSVEDGGVPRSRIVKDLAGDERLTAPGGQGVVTPFLFGDKLYPVQQLHPDSLTFTSGHTDIAAALEQAAEAVRERNLRALVLVSDGIVTAGRNPVHVAEALGIPVHVIAVGDSAEKRDLVISRVLANDIAYVGTSMPVDVTVRANGIDGGQTVVTLRDGGTVVERSTVTLSPGSSEYQVRFSYVPATPGTRALSVEAAPVSGELTQKNNRRSVFVKVLKSRMSVVMIAGAPSADVSLVEQSFRNDPNVDLRAFVQKTSAAWYGETPGKAVIDKADCIVLVGYPLEQSGTEPLRLVRAALETRNTPLLIIFSREISHQKLRAALDPWLPYEVVQSRLDETQVFFEPTSEAAQHPVTSTGIARDVWRELPPLFRTESSYRPRPGALALGAMKLNGIVFNEPLLLARRVGRSKVLVSTGYGLWRWQLDAGTNGRHVTDALLSNTVRWLTTREDDKRVRIRPAREFFDSGDRIEFNAQVYNESLAPVDDAAIAVRVRGNGEERELTLSPLGAGRYSGVLEGVREGEYTYAGSATKDGATLGSDDGRFNVGELNVEFLETRMNNQLLRQIAAVSGGRVISADRLDDLGAALASSPDFVPVDRELQDDIPLWNMLWLLLAAIAAFAAEWFLRKQAGML